MKQNPNALLPRESTRFPAHPTRRIRMKLPGWLLFLVIFLIVQGCNTPAPPDPALLAIQTVTAEYEAAVAATAAQVALVPTETPVPIREKMLFVSAGMTNEALTQSLRDIFNAADFPLDVEESAELPGGSVPKETTLVFYGAEPEGLTDFAAAHPDKMFVILGKGAAIGANVYSVRYDPTFEPFMAGFMLAITANDWRGGALVPSDDPVIGEAFGVAVKNGMRYFCGPCKSIAPPYGVYPPMFALPRGSAPADWIAKLSELSATPVNTMYVPSAVESFELLNALSQAATNVVLSGNPPEGWAGNWVGSLRIDLSKTLMIALEEIATGNAPNVITPPIDMIVGNKPEVFSDGRMRLIEKTYADLVSGLVLTSDPVPQAGYAK